MLDGHKKSSHLLTGRGPNSNVILFQLVILKYENHLFLTLRT